MLGYTGFEVAAAWRFQEAESRHFDRVLAAGHPTIEAEREAASFKPPIEVLPVMMGDPIGRVEIPRLGLSAMVVEGVGRSSLRRAVGHIPGTALPGEHGNTAISAHRDTYFRPLRNIQHNDMITLTTVGGRYDYRVVSMKIVSPKEVGVLDPRGTQTLTLITCYPFYFVGAAPNRFIVRAERVTW